MSEENPIEEYTKQYNSLLDKTDDIHELILLWKEAVNILKGFEAIDERLRVKIKTYLKERNWKRYMDEETKISVTLTSQKRQKLDKTQLKMMLTEAQLAQITLTTTFEKLSIVTQETRQRLKQIVRKNKPKRKVSKKT